MSISSEVSLEFIPAAGSSKSKSVGFVAIARAISSFLCLLYGEQTSSGATTIWEAFNGDYVAYNSSANAYKYTGHSTYSYWWNETHIYRSDYTDYYKMFKYTKTEKKKAAQLFPPRIQFLMLSI